MVKVAVLVAPGFEEGETLTIVDIIRRANIECELVGTDEIVTGAHDITVKCDVILDANLSDSYDMVVLPGGRPGADNLRDNESVIKVIKEMDAEGKWVAAMCAAPIALEQAGILENRNYTAYVGYQDIIKVGNFKEDIVVVDKNLVTSRGPATAYEFAYALVDVLGGDSIAVKNVWFIQMHLMLRREKSMAKVAVLMAEGYEEGETLTIVDILRRADIETATFYFGDDEFVKGMHNMYIKADKKFGSEVYEYDVVVLPGGRPGGANLLANPEVIKLVKDINATEGKYIGAMCSGTVVLSEAKVIDGKDVTGYTGYAEKLIGGNFKEDVVVFDKNIITSQGPATPYPFAYKIAEVLGKDTAVLRERMLYNFACGR